VIRTCILDDGFTGVVAADYGHYGPFFIRMAWHSAGTYRIGDGRGGRGSGTHVLRHSIAGRTMRASIRRAVLWPIKEVWPENLRADLMILAGNVSLSRWGSRPSVSAAGARTSGSPKEDIFWGPESKWMGDRRYSGDRQPIILSPLFKWD
jgi:catalase-peroxidase